MAEIRVLIVDDNRMVRDLLSDIFESDPGIAVVGKAENGLRAAELVSTLKPDVVAMDINMPVMNGIEAIEKIMASTPVPILVITDLDHAEIAFAALSKGALDVYQKSFASEKMAAELIGKIKLLSKVKVIRHIQPRRFERRSDKVATAQRRPSSHTAAAQVQVTGKKKLHVVAIASSTGGPRALAQIFSGMDGGFPASMVVAQHMSDGFVSGLVKWLNSVTPVQVKLADDGELMRENHAYFAPGGMHVTVNANGRLKLQQSAPADLLYPSCNLLLDSVGKSFGKNSAGVILTGMGNDGVEGIRSIREHGGFTLAQDEATSVVYGMPKAAIERGLIDKVCPLGEIGGALKLLLRERT